MARPKLACRATLKAGLLEELSAPEQGVSQKLMRRKMLQRGRKQVKASCSFLLAAQRVLRGGVLSSTGCRAERAALLCRASKYAAHGHRLRCVQAYRRAGDHGGNAFVCICTRTTMCLTLHCDSKDDSPTISVGIRSMHWVAVQREQMAPAARWVAATAGCSAAPDHAAPSPR